MNLERRYTLAEARVEFIRRECSARGHDLTIAYAGGKPVRLFCERGCGESYDVVPRDGVTS